MKIAYCPISSDLKTPETIEDLWDIVIKQN